MVVQLGFATIPFGIDASAPGVDLGDDEGDVRVHPPGRRVVDHDGARGGDPGGELQRGRGSAREQGDVDAGEVGPDDVFHDDLGAIEAEGAAGRPGACEETHPLEGKSSLHKDGPHHGTDLPGGTENPDSHDRSLVADLGHAG